MPRIYNHSGDAIQIFEHHNGQLLCVLNNGEWYHSMLNTDIRVRIVRSNQTSFVANIEENDSLSVGVTEWCTY